jgi:hypothetical protein
VSLLDPSYLKYSKFIFISFLDDVERIAVKYYIPTDDDIIHARLKASGIREYKITLHHGMRSGRFNPK